MIGEVFDSSFLADNIILYDDFTFLDDIVDSEDLASENQDDSTVGVTISQPLSTSSISDNQERVLSIVLVVSATLSILGSASIIYKIIRDRQLSKPYHRTMIALSISDVISSLTFALYPFLMPKGVRVWSVGSEATCTALGFFTQLSFAAIGYNCILSFYYLLAIRFNTKRKKFSQTYELPMHLINLVFFLTTASVGAAKQFYSAVDVGFGCWINDWPKGCDQTGDCISQSIAIIFAGIPVPLSFLAIVINNLIVYFHVRTIFNSLKKVSLAAATNSSQRLSAKEAIAVRFSQKRSELYDQKLSEVAFQGFLYVGSFLVCYTPALATRVVEAFTYNYDDSKLYWLLVITAMTLPLQGFFNMFIYNRPYYVKIRNSNPHISVLRTMHAAFLESKSLITPKPSFASYRESIAFHQGKESSSKSVISSRYTRGALEVVMEEGSQLSDDDEDKDEHNEGINHSENRTDNDSDKNNEDISNTAEKATTENDSTFNDDENDEKNDENVNENYLDDNGNVPSPQSTTTVPAVVSQRQGSDNSIQELDASGRSDFSRD